MDDSRDTIVAIATPPGKGGVGIVRLSGPAAKEIAATIVHRLPAPRKAAHREFRDDTGAIDSGLVLVFDQPNSYTGDDVVEFHGHGGPVVLDLLLRRILALGARQAAPGEFTQRAYLNDRIDLAEAEAVADLIDAGSEAAARAAQRSLSGEFSRRVDGLRAEIEAIRIEVEASIDFADEDIQLQEEAGVRRRLNNLRANLSELLANAGQGRLLAEGCTVVIAGRPNAGKSSLLNALTGHDAAIVTDIPGTTRDILRERVSLNGLPITLLDTAGLRDSNDPVESEGIRRAKTAIDDADHVLYLVDSSDAAAIESAASEIKALGRAKITTCVYTKSDLRNGPSNAGLNISINSTQSLDRLRAYLMEQLGYTHFTQSALSARTRHLDALKDAQHHLALAATCAENGDTDLLAEELFQAHQALGAITGRMSSDDLLGRIFSAFCIGK